MNKRALLNELQERVRGDLDTLERRQKDAEEGATHEENRAEHAKDTRATEQSYLARGLADRVADLRRTLDALDGLTLATFADGSPIALTAVVVLSTGDDAEAPEEEAWFLVPGAGGVTLESGGVPIRTVTPVAPLGRALIGLVEGDEGTLKTPSGPREFEILKVR